ncbi:MAG TPA: hypothetical protein VLE97_06615 [Gaiellaceae bacterium]|nr:hypothetical protein [Gaiellaceae bacterium]
MSDMFKNWFEVDRKGLTKLIERRGKIALVLELIANGLDADGTTRVEVLLEPEQGVPHATVLVTDDSPEGFADISHSWTLFAESNRKAYPTKRGRFNLGEKLVLALCVEASIISTKGAVMFDSRGRSNIKARRDRGTEFQGIARITRAELVEIKEGLRTLIPPPGVTIVVNKEELPTRMPLATVEATLMTEIVDEENYLKRSPRKTVVHIYEVLPGETATLYEMGIPVVETGDKWHVDVQQKVPLNMDRDNVTPAYLRDVRTLVVNAMHAQLDAADANTTFVNEALADENAAPEAVTKALDLKFSEKRAIRDPSDPEANMNLVAQGYTLINSNQLTREQWDNVKKHDAERTRPAGQIAPTHKVKFSPDGEDRWVPREKWTPAMRAVVAYSADVCRELVGARVEVSILLDITEKAAACYGSQGLVFNLGRLGKSFFEECLTSEQVCRENLDRVTVSIMRPTVRLNELLIHEIGHHIESNHLDERYHDALCTLGAKLTHLALAKPELFRREVD